MAFWSSEKIRSEQINNILVFPYDTERVKHCSYELSLGPEAFITADSNGKRHEIKQEIKNQLCIPPGQFGILITEEEVNIPAKAIGFISIKFGIKFCGLVNISGFHVDPGFKGKLKFSVYNAGAQDVVLARGEPLFLIWFSDLDCTTGDPYTGVHKNQNSISSADIMNIKGDTASPNELHQRLKQLEDERQRREDRWKHFHSPLITATIGAIIGTIITIFLTYYRASNPNNPTSMTTSNTTTAQPAAKQSSQ